MRAAGTLLTAALAVVTAAGALAQHAHRQDMPGAPQPYAGQQQRPVASLSAEELQGFLEGRGMGLAKSAELNGYPGPVHVLQLERELRLSAHQRAHVEQVFQKMQARAAELGRQYIDAERSVDAAFKSSAAADTSTISARVLEASRILGELRLAHLEAHVEITPLLTPEQRARYAELRGYSDPAAHPQTHKH